MSIPSLQPHARTRALLSCAALMALSSAVVPGLMPQRARVGAVRLNNGVVHRLLASRWGGAPPPEILIPVAFRAAAEIVAVAPAASGHAGGLPFPAWALPRPEFRSENLTFASLVAVRWRNLSPFHSRPPPKA